MKKIILLSLLISSINITFAAGTDQFISFKESLASFTITSNGKSVPIIVSSNEHKGVVRAAKDLLNDIQKVSGNPSDLLVDQIAPQAIIIGTIGQSEIIDRLIRINKINVAGVANKWESTLIQVVSNPVDGIESALVIAGSDKRGTIYGIYETCYQIGVSPWYYWADVPVKKNAEIYALPGRHITSSPAVKYRGIFLNDEAPALTGWSKKEFGGFNHQFYEKVFELILRLKGNYLWPAMWGSAFIDDDPLNPVLADEYGIVMGTTHHEPMTRAHDEWRRYGSGKWDYSANETVLKKFWEDGYKRTVDKEQIISLGMRGDGDEPMTQGTAISLLEKIVKDQREIIEKVSEKPANETPQLWALYKEVQDYYDQGMRVPDDVTLLLCDDNWGNLRKLPNLKETPRKGGYGIYYHFDYVGGPRNYKWINTNPIQKIWEQMNLAYEYDANEIWIVNVGDLKPMEFPIEFFLDYAWAPDAIPAEKLFEYTLNWSKKQFGESFTPQIAQFIDTYLKFNGRVKPELLNDKTYSLTNYREFETVVADFNNLLKQAEQISNRLPAEYKDAYYQLVLHPIMAGANLNELYFTVAKNKMYAKQGRAVTNDLRIKTKELFDRDAEISHYYNKIMANGKWDHMMDQTHIGYTYWQQPPADVIPKTDSVIVPASAKMGISIEESDKFWIAKNVTTDALPTFDYYSNTSQYFEIFNQGSKYFTYKISAPAYVKVSSRKGLIKDQERIEVSIDWEKAPKSQSQSFITVTGTDGSKIGVKINLDNRRFEAETNGAFVQKNGYISMEGPNYSRAIHKRPVFWKNIPNYGKTLGGMTVVPVTSPAQALDVNTPHLAYDIFIKDAGEVVINSFISPTIDFKNEGGLKFAVSIDDEEPIVVNISKDYMNNRAWEKSVAENIKIFKTPISINRTGKHILKYWMIDTGVVLQKLVIDAGGLKPSFLGPQETYIK